MISLASSIRTAHLTALAAALTGGTLRLYAGTAPAPGAAETGQPLLAAIAIGVCTVEGDTLSLALSSTTGLANGEATWCRAVSAADAPVLDGDCGITGSGACVELRTTAISPGVSIAPLSASLSYP